MKRAQLINAALAVVAVMAVALAGSWPAMASSHREAPMISMDPTADQTDLYAFTSPDKPDTVTLIGNWIPFEEPAGGPNFNMPSDDVLYAFEIDNVGDAMPHIVYQFRFKTTVGNGNTFLYNTGAIDSIDSANLNVKQTYTVTRLDNGVATELGSGLLTAPANIGPKSTPNYGALMAQAIHTLSDGSKVFVGPADDPFFVDLGAVFDLLTIRKLPGDMGGGVDGLKGYNVHAFALQIPKTRLTKDGAAVSGPAGDNAIIGVWGTTYRQASTVLRPGGQKAELSGDWVQVSRLGAPLVNEVVVPLAAKDLWNNSQPKDDAQFLAGVTDPEPARLLTALYGIKTPPAPRNDLVAVFLTGVPGATMPAGVTPSEQLRLNMGVPPSASENRFGVIGGDLGGFPNGRRLADDVTDIELRALAGVLVEGYNTAPGNALGDGVDVNDAAFQKTFPYVAMPWQGFESMPHGAMAQAPAPGMGAAPGMPRTGTGLGEHLADFYWVLIAAMLAGGIILLAGGAVLRRRPSNNK